MALAVFFTLFCVAQALAQEVEVPSAHSSAFRSTPYPLPRFVSLSKNKAFVRTGPGERYPIKWIFKKKGLPLEITLEYENWRRIKDHEGEEGWIYHSLLSGKRTGLILHDDLVPIHRKADKDSRLMAYIEPKALVALEKCEGAWCKLKAQGYEGWAERRYIWGVYEAENF